MGIDARSASLQGDATRHFRWRVVAGSLPLRERRLGEFAGLGLVEPGVGRRERETMGDKKREAKAEGHDGEESVNRQPAAQPNEFGKSRHGNAFV
jgi:hypothetical protein